LLLSFAFALAFVVAFKTRHYSICVKKIDYDVVKNLIRAVGGIIRFRQSNQFLAKGCAVGRFLFLFIVEKKKDSIGHCPLPNYFSETDGDKSSLCFIFCFRLSFPLSQRGTVASVRATGRSR